MTSFNLVIQAIESHVLPLQTFFGPQAVFAETVTKPHPLTVLTSAQSNRTVYNSILRLFTLT